MNLFILRHASAGTRRINPLLDLKRPLDKDGKSHCLQLAHVLMAMKINFDLIVSSPLKRSLQTAQLVGTETGYESRILISNALAPTATFDQFQRLLRECAPHENLLVVGHNPNITAFLGQLIDPSVSSISSLDDRTPSRVRLRKGSLARLTLMRGPATLQWLLDPRIVRSLYATSTKSSRRKISRK
ncbi:SixA phosphatase family protein [Granulicella mallensis]|uniref:Putative phosphohistidine phosphatase, SixA n=1 Tax=Granulicella mallensis (strain ATCC BAA-1857 / DSM 23137 / MP5ACTX8) TaxID=682795 RepID=G8NPK6_GRAMM|nr:histidine phosphatase family protein [Granulicella mallensis]AEU36018.1 putative phosphohistidine phosphatase, SixA [Granulicella mallensis MP5ACTX8]